MRPWPRRLSGTSANSPRSERAPRACSAPASPGTPTPDGPPGPPAATRVRAQLARTSPSGSRAGLAAVVPREEPAPSSTRRSTRPGTATGPRTSPRAMSALSRRRLRPSVRDARFATPAAAGRTRNRVLLAIRCTGCTDRCQRSQRSLRRARPRLPPERQPVPRHTATWRSPRPANSGSPGSGVKRVPAPPLVRPRRPHLHLPETTSALSNPSAMRPL